jgi:N-acetyl-alpha-D-glucosaminyl L-malate synthase BshA
VAQREELQVMHVHYAIPHAATAWLAKQMLADERDLKVVTTLHGTDITLVGKDPSYFSLTKFSIEHSDRVTAVSAFLRDETFRTFGCDGCEVLVIPNFVNKVEYFPARNPAERGTLAPADTRVLIHISNFRPVKRLVDVVRVFAGVRKAMKARLVMVGDGPDRDPAQREATKLGVQHDVRFAGRVDDVADVLRGGDLFLLPSETESFGLAALEAMACGVPVIASSVGGLVDTVVHGGTGLHVPPRRPDRVAEAARQLIADAGMRRRLGPRGSGEARNGWHLIGGHLRARHYCRRPWCTPCVVPVLWWRPSARA